jgi:hypothetical protein
MREKTAEAGVAVKPAPKRGRAAARAEGSALTADAAQATSVPAATGPDGHLSHAPDSGIDRGIDRETGFRLRSAVIHRKLSLGELRLDQERPSARSGR